MNSAFTHHNAETKAGRLARAIRFAALACALVLGAGSALAQQQGDRRDDQGVQQTPRFRLPPQHDRGQRNDLHTYDEQRQDQRQEPRRAQQQEQQHDSRRSGRMTEDERRDLRRQINEAGMDLYPQRR